MKKIYFGIEIDLDRNKYLNEFSIDLISKYYLANKDEDPQEAFARAAIAYCANDLSLAQRIYDYASLGWFMYASPVLSNAPMPGEKVKALPISCYLGSVDDNLESLIEHSAELKWLSVKGGGIGGHWSNVRSVSKKAPGPIPFLKTVDSDIEAYSQGVTRRGSYAAYLDVSHPDFEEFLNIRVPTGGDINRKCFNLHNAVNITDEFMQAVIQNQEWNFIDPHDKTIRSTVRARELWQRILEVRFKTGEPYLNFIDEANRKLPQPLKDKNLKINGSNLCNEIHLPTSADRIAVCCLSSVNLEKYDEWKDTNIIRDLIRFLDNVLQVFIDNCPKVLHKAKYSAQQERSLGLGAMGFHSYLQSKMIPWDSSLAKIVNLQIFEKIQSDAILETELLAKERGEYPDGIGSGRRNSHLLAIAPNANSSVIVSSSPSIEPIKSNAYTHRMRAGTFLVKNKYLEEVILKYIPEANPEAWLDKVWTSIITNQGSVQHLDFLSQEEKDLFKTAFEIDQNWVVQHASDRQKFICQGQSVNLFFPSNSERSYVNQVHLKAWKEGLKGLYYLRSDPGVTADKVSHKVERKALQDYAESKDSDECIACHG